MAKRNRARNKLARKAEKPLTISDLLSPGDIVAAIREFNSCHRGKAKSLCLVWLDTEGNVLYLDAGWQSTLELSGAIQAVSQCILTEEDSE